MKKLLSILLTASLLLALAACTQAPAEPQEPVDPSAPSEPTQTESERTGVTVRIGGLKGPTTMGIVKLLDDADSGLTRNDYAFQMAAAADELTPLLLKGELDVLAGPVNLGAVLANNSGGAVQLAAVTTLGVLYIVEKGGETVTDLSALAGKTLYATGKGTTPEYALKFLLSQAGLDPETDLSIEWKSEPSEVVAQLAASESGVAMLPQPFVTVAQGKVEGLRVALDLTEQWDALGLSSRLLTAGLIVRTAFAEENPEAIAALLADCADSAQWINDNPAEGAVLVEQYGIVAAAVAEKAIPHCNLTCLTGEEMRAAAEGYLQTLFDQNPAAVGGAMPGEAFYHVG